MIKIVRKLIVISFLAIPTIGVAKDIDQDDAKVLRDQGRILPLEQVLKVALRLHPGRVIEVELEKARGLYVYEIEIADDNGRVWEVKLDASNASVISQEQDD